MQTYGIVTSNIPYILIRYWKTYKVCLKNVISISLDFNGNIFQFATAYKSRAGVMVYNPNE